MIRLHLAILILTGLNFVSHAAEVETDKRLPPMGGKWGIRKPATPDPALPNVLLIGDSIANGYLEPVRKALIGKANVEAWITPTTQADKSLGSNLAGICQAQKYAVIHFNLGLHGWQKGRIPEDQFEPLTQKLVRDLKQAAPEAALIWATITPVSVKGEPTKLNPDVQPIIDKHNAMATKVMKAEGVPINDLNALVSPHLNLMSGDMFHWKAEASEMMAKAVAEQILMKLAKPL
jgi:lysophospholipase L1-like esterase